MSSAPDFSGLWIPLITPFRGDAVDHAALTRLVARLRAAGVTGFVACGSTGEAAALDKAEQRAVLDTVLQAAGPLPVVMGVSGYHLPHTQTWMRELASLPLHGWLVPAPHYIRPAQAGLLHWFTALADTARAPVIVYDIPYRTGAVLTLDTLRRLGEHPNIRAIKDCGGDARKTEALLTDGNLQVLAGEDAQVFDTLAAGGVGAITATAHLATAHFVQLLADLRAERLAPARARWRLLAPLVAAVFAEPNPALIKAHLARQGDMTPDLRAPMTAGSAPAAQRVADRLAALDAAALNRP